MSSSEPQSKKGGGHRRLPQAGSTSTGRRMIFILLGLALCIGIFIMSVYPMVMKKTDTYALIKIPRNATQQMVKDSLTKYFGEDYTRNVLRLAKLRNVDISKRNGAYAIEKGENALNGMRKLTSGGQTPVKITINGFRNLPKLIDLVSLKMEFPADSLRAALNDPDLLAEYGLTPENAMAIFFNDTYEAYWNTSARDLVRKIGETYRYIWDESRVEHAADLGLTPAQMMTLASIVDEETNNEDEKGIIGRLYINRLNNDMKLQADPTVRFAMGNFTIQRVTHKDLQTDSPYNTYLHKGLPPGPIRTTSAQTIFDILDSKPNNFLYMCAKEDFSGRHNFSSSYEEHLKNAARYQAALNQRGITR